jgi:hypothetical protein
MREPEGSGAADPQNPLLASRGGALYRRDINPHIDYLRMVLWRVGPTRDPLFFA